MVVSRENVMNALTDQQWNEYEERGCLVLGRVLEDQALAELRERIDQIMLGEADLDYDRIFASMKQPAFLFDGRNILDLKRLSSIGFRVFGIGKHS